LECTGGFKASYRRVKKLTWMKKIKDTKYGSSAGTVEIRKLNL